MTESQERQTVESLVGQLLKNSLLIFLASAVGAVSLVLAVPFIVASLGTEGYGVWELMLAVSGVAMVFSMVLNGAVQWQISRSYGAQDPAETRRLVRISVGATMTLIVIFVPVTWLIRERLVRLLEIPEQLTSTAAWLLPLIVGIMLLGGLNEALMAVLTGYQKAGAAALVRSLGLVLTNLTAIGLLLMGFGLDSLLAGYLAGFAAKLAVLYPLACSQCGRISLIPLSPSARDVKLLGGFAGLLLLSHLSLLLRDNTDKILLASFGSPAITGYFSMAQRLSMVVMQMATVGYIPFTAAVAALHARQDWQGIRELYSRIGVWVPVLAGLIAFLFCTLRQPLFVLWLGKSYPEAHVFLALLLFGSTSAIIFSGAGAALAKGIGRPGLETTYTLITLGLTLLSKPLLIAGIGAVGSVASSAASWSLGAVFLLFLIHRRLDVPQQVVWQAGGLFAVTLTLSLAGWWLGGWFAPPTHRAAAVLTLVGLGPVFALFYLAVLVGLRILPFADLRSAAAERLSRITKKRGFRGTRR